MGPNLSVKTQTIGTVAQIWCHLDSQLDIVQSTKFYGDPYIWSWQKDYTKATGYPSSGDISSKQSIFDDVNGLNQIW